MAEVLGQLSERFKLDMSMIKKRAESLIEERWYLGGEGVRGRQSYCFMVSPHLSGSETKTSPTIYPRLEEQGIWRESGHST